jgi:hypothetical protein
MVEIPRCRLHFEYNSGWQSYVDTCQRCGWSGPLEQGDREHFGDLMEIWCPQCGQADGTKLALISYPLVQR